MKNIIFTSCFLIASFISFGQASKNINNYKYAIVSSKFDFLKEKDKYQANSLTKFLFNKKFTAFLDDEKLPNGLLNNKCDALMIDVEDDSGMLSTTLILNVKNCVGDVLFTSEGKSKLKSYKKAYQKAIRNAYDKFSAIDYNYIPLEKSKTKEKEVVVIEKPIEKKEKIIAKPVVEKMKETDIENLSKLYAQQKENGFQLINTKPEIIFFILNTNIKDVYIIKEKNGILYNKNGIWIAEYLENNTMKSEKYQIKF